MQVKWFDNGTSFVDQQNLMISRQEIDIKLAEYRVGLARIRARCTQFSICLPPANGFFESNAAKRKYVDEKLREICNDLDILLIPTDSLWQYLMPWRKDQYHFDWNSQETSGPPLIWATFDVNAAVYCSLFQLNQDTRFYLQTCPYYNLAPFPDGENNLASFEMPIFNPITTQLIIPAAVPWYSTTGQAVEMIHNRTVFIPLWEIDLIRNPKETEDQVYFALRPHYVDALIPKDVCDIQFDGRPTSGARVVRIKDFPKGNHITFSYCSKATADFLAEVWWEWIKGGKVQVDDAASSSTGAAASETQTRYKYTYLAAQIIVNETVLPNPKKKEAHSYMLDLKPVGKEALLEIKQLGIWKEPR